MYVIEGGLKQKIKANNDLKRKYLLLYKRNLYKALFDCHKKKIIFYGVKYINNLDLNSDLNILKEAIKVCYIINNTIKSISIGELMKIFPVDKNKNYKNAIKSLNKFNQNSKIYLKTNNIIDLYNNSELYNFTIKNFKIANAVSERESNTNIIKDLKYLLKYYEKPNISKQKKKYRNFKIL